jgi:biopolymer transport protein ExbD
MVTSYKCSDNLSLHVGSGMLKAILSITFIASLSAVGSSGQTPQGKPELRHPQEFPRVNPSTSGSTPGDNKTILIEIAADKRVRIPGVKGLESWAGGPKTINNALARSVATQESKPFEHPVYPRVMVRVAPELDIKTVIDLLKVARNGSAKLSVEITEHSFLLVPPEPPDRVELEVKPNPLFLLAAFDDKGLITLNNEASGSLKDLSIIGSKLKQVFKEREENGVFRENTNEIEKSVFLRAPESASFSHLASLANAISSIGGDRLWLAIEKVGFLEDPVEPEDSDSIMSLRPINPKENPRPKAKTRSKRKPNE